MTIYLPNPDVSPIGFEPAEFIDPPAAEGGDPVRATRKSVSAGSPAAALAPDPELVPQGTADTAAETGDGVSSDLGEAPDRTGWAGAGEHQRARTSTGAARLEQERKNHER